MDKKEVARCRGLLREIHRGIYKAWRYTHKNVLFTLAEGAVHQLDNILEYMLEHDEGKEG